jgi:hypothetical protein
MLAFTLTLKNCLPMKPAKQNSAQPSRRSPSDVSLPLGDQETPWAARAAWALVIAGLVLRLARYLQGFPLWGDECMLAVNFIDRGYLDLVRPLDHYQICPLLFLWAEATAVKLLGFSVWSLRLFPMLCSVASLLLFHHLARRLLRGGPLVLAVGVFAVSYYLVRHGTEVKQYSLDVLVALGLLTPVVEWWRRPESRAWLWVLVGLAPLAMLASLPGSFVAGAVSAALLPSIWWRRDKRTWIAYVVYHVTLLVSFAVMYVVFLKPHQAWALENGIHAYNRDGFPPLWQPLPLLAWLADVHTSRMFAFPVGGERGASVLTTLCWLIGLVVLVRRGRRDLALLFTAPFGLGLLGAALHKYPYGVNTRTTLYLAPAICLMAGLGAATVSSWFRSAQWRLRGLKMGVVLLGMVAAISLVRDLTHPYKTGYDRQANEFARWFWTEMGRDAELVCLINDFKIVPFPDPVGFTSAEYDCYQRMYSPRHRQGGATLDQATLDRVSARRPLRCVLQNVPEGQYDQAKLTRWLRRMQQDFELVDVRTFPVNADADTCYRRRYDVYEFRPRGNRHPELARLLGPAGERSARR